jgi:hypothetical protein
MTRDCMVDTSGTGRYGSDPVRHGHVLRQETCSAFGRGYWGRCASLGSADFTNDTISEEDSPSSPVDVEAAIDTSSCNCPSFLVGEVISALIDPSSESWTILVLLSLEVVISSSCGAFGIGLPAK